MTFDLNASQMDVDSIENIDDSIGIFQPVHWPVKILNGTSMSHKLMFQKNTELVNGNHL